MINAKSTLLHLKLSTESPTRAIQEVRERVENSETPINKANSIIADITGVQKDYKDIRLAMHIAQAVTIAAIKHETFDPEETIYAAENAAKKLRSEQGWMFAEAGCFDVRAKSEEVQFVEGLDVKVAVKADGTLKKGSKGVLAEELYKKHMMGDNPLSNKEFVELLIKEAKFTKAGASTYAYNMRKKFSPETN